MNEKHDPDIVNTSSAPYIPIIKSIEMILHSLQNKSALWIQPAETDSIYLRSLLQ